MFVTQVGEVRLGYSYSRLSQTSFQWSFLTSHWLWHSWPLLEICFSHGVCDTVLPWLTSLFLIITFLPSWFLPIPSSLFLIYPSLDGHSGCFHILAIVNCANLGAMSLQDLISIFLDKYPEVGLLDHKAVLFLIFWGTSIPFSVMVTPFCIPINSVQGFRFLHILTNSCCLLVFP